MSFTPSKGTKNFARDVTADLNTDIDDLLDNQSLDTQKGQEKSASDVLLSRPDFNVFSDLIGVLKSNDIGSFKNILQSKEFQRIGTSLPLACGKNIGLAPIILDLAEVSNLLIEGGEESEKNQIVNILILSLILNKTPSELKLILVDSQGLELSRYERIGHLVSPVITSAHKCIFMFEWLIEEMERRFALIKKLKARNFMTLKNYEMLPYIVVVIDELYNLVATIPYELETNLNKLSLKANSVGIHFIFATKKSLTDISIDSIQSNFSTRLHLYESKITVIFDSREESIQGYLIDVSSSEISILANKLRGLYPFSNENINIK